MNQNKNMWTAISLTAFVILWGVVSMMKIIPAVLFPSPLSVFKLYFTTEYWHSIFDDVCLTVLRVLIGFFISVIIGTPIGYLVGYSSKVNASLSFLIDFSRSIPVVALFPLFLIFFGIGESTIVATSAWSGSFVMIVNGAYGIKNSNLLRQKMAKVFGGSRLTIFKKVIFYDTLPYIFSGFRITISMCLIVVVLSEMLLSSRGGLGQRVYDSALLFQSKELYSIIIILGTIGFILNRVSLLCEHRILHWNKSEFNI